VFSSHDGVGRIASAYMSQPFLDFAKAYYLYTNATSSPKTYVVRLAALRALEKALVEAQGTSNACLVTAAIFTAHTTEIGFCVHDFTMLPCQKHRDCINCGENVCVKGDARRTRRIMEQLEVAEEQLRRATASREEGFFGADRWVEHHQATVARLRALAQALNDPSVPAGAIIRMVNPGEHSPIRMAIQERRELGDESVAALAVDFGLIPTLGGGA
jgi:hypothetical protein